MRIQHEVEGQNTTEQHNKDYFGIEDTGEDHNMMSDDFF